MNRQPTDRPNAVVFFADQQRWDSTGVHGNPLNLTPTLLDAAGLPVHCHMQARSVLPLTRGAANDWPERVRDQGQPGN
jgi:arylsulfatase A-like enzyme